MEGRRASAISLGLLLLAGIALYSRVLSKLARDWAANDDYSHGFLIVPLALYFAWRSRHRLARLDAAPSNLGLLLVLGGVGILAAGVLGAELFLQRVSLLAVIAGTIVFLLGWAHLKVLAFPVLFLLLMIPIPSIIFNQVAFPLQLLASQAGELALRTAGVPVLREGNVITLSNTTLQVAEACSGIRSLISLLTLAIVYGYFTLRRPVSRALLAAASLPVAIVANAVRVAGTGFAAHYVGAEAAEGFFHTFSGWLVFLLAFVFLWAVRGLIAKALHEGPPVRSEGAEEESSRVLGKQPRRWPVRPVAVIALLLVSRVAIADVSRTEPVLPRQPFATFPVRLGDWQGERTSRFDQQVLTILGVDEYINRIYQAPGGRMVGLYVGYYSSQRQGDTIHSPLNCLPGAGWEPVTKRRLPLAVAEGRNGSGSTSSRRAPVVNRLLIRKGADRQVVLYWYQGHGRVTASEYWGKIYAVLDAIRLNRTDGALVRIVSPVIAAGADGEQQADEAAFGFARELFPVLETYLPD
jgi:exosortase D (VPLPA-CTERM-specific)